MAKLKEYHFDLGDSTNGPVGFCAVIRATSKEKALEILREELQQEHEIQGDSYLTEGVVYITAYFNADAIKAKDIDYFDEVEASACAGLDAPDGDNADYGDHI